MANTLAKTKRKSSSQVLMDQTTFYAHTSVFNNITSAVKSLAHIQRLSHEIVLKTSGNEF